MQTIVCRDCRELFDAVTGYRVVASPLWQGRAFGLGLTGAAAPRAGTGVAAPNFQTALNRLPPAGAVHCQWLQYKPQCPVSVWHRVEAWNNPAKCPKCGVYLDRSALPFRIWE